MTLFLTGLPTSGKTTAGLALSKALNCPFFDTDKLLEEDYFLKTGERLICHEIFRKEGDSFFRTLEKEIVQRDLKGIIALGGGAMPPSQKFVIYLKGETDLLWERIKLRGLPAFLLGENPERKFREIAKERHLIYEKMASFTLKIDGLSLEQIVERILWEVTPLEIFSESQLGENRMEKPLAL